MGIYDVPSRKEKRVLRITLVLRLVGYAILIVNRNGSFVIISLGFWLVWLGVMYWSIVNTVSGHYDSVISLYPREKCIEPKKMSFLFLFDYKRAKKGIPQELFVIVVITFVWSIAGSIVWILYAILKVMWLGYVLLFGSILGYSMLCIILALKAEVICFYVRYKVMNRHNIKYLFYTGNQPTMQSMGKCRIAAIEKVKKKRAYVCVQLLDTDQMVSHVLADPLLLKNKREQIYKLNCLCKVYWI